MSNRCIICDFYRFKFFFLILEFEMRQTIFGKRNSVRITFIITCNENKNA